MDNAAFEALIRAHRGAIERFVYYKLSGKADADDVLQEAYLAAYARFDTLKDPAAFQAWMIRIARNKLTDYFRARAKQPDCVNGDEKMWRVTRMGVSVAGAVRDTLSALPDKDSQILGMYYLANIKQAEIAKTLDIPLGTVKSRLHAAKQNFKRAYPYPPNMKGATKMHKLPKLMPEYSITKLDKAPFSVIWEEMMGWFIVPKLGEKLSWGMYDQPSRVCDHIYDMRVVGKARVHGVEGVEIEVNDVYAANKDDMFNCTFVAQLTDTHSRFLAACRREEGEKQLITFLDEEEFMPNWGFGEDNRGNETHLSAKGDIIRDGDKVTSASKPFLIDIVGRYAVEINGKTYDTVCVMDIETYDTGMICEHYLDSNGRVILWRRFNKDDWAIERYGQRWTEKLKDNERIYVNGNVFVHWYDCITDYIL